MNRRSFLKFIGVASATAALPNLAVATPAELAAPEAIAARSLIREVVLFDGVRQVYNVRYDMMLGAAHEFRQWWVDCCVDRVEDIEKARAPALMVLRDQLEHDGFTEADLAPPVEILGVIENNYVNLR